MTKISDLPALAAVDLDATADIIPIVDMSEAPGARNKQIAVSELASALGAGDMLASNNLSDLVDISDARDNLDVYSKGEVNSAIAGAGGGDMLSANNLADVDDVPTARDNLDVYSTSEVDAAIAAGAGTASYACADNTLGTFSNTAFPSRGPLLVPLAAMKIKGAWFKVNETSGSGYVVTIYQVDGSNVITAVLASSAARTSPSTGTAKPYFSFTSPVSLSAGSRYAMLLRRTDGTDTTSADSYGGTGDAKGLPVEDTATYCRIAKKTPAIGDAIGIGANPYYYGVAYAVA